MNHLRWLSMPFVAALLVLAVACGGDDNDDGVSTGSSAGATATRASGSATGATDAPTGSTGSNASTGATRATGSTGATESTGNTGSTGGTGAQGTLNVENIAAGLENVDSFRFNVTLKMEFEQPEGQTGGEDAAAAAMLMALLGNIEMEGAYVAPDRFQTSMTFFGMDLEAIQIGDQAWINDGSGWTADATGGMAGEMPFELSSPADFFEFIPAEELEGAETSRETINGIETTKYHFDKDSLVALAESSGESMGMEDLSEVDTLDLDIWLTDEGLPVRMIMDMQGESEGSEIAMQMEYNISDLNDSSISIEPPI